ncbi:hypothetical protein PBRA_006551 [Plasmodiophora brassicae]|uniref:CCHC-type domain-containing protein n=1 Tax=Plasmodiophora brassicae TaxID=37360 RepID=A0A0G4IT82_PLABS|nr:hypothetical protein PBRA_006551 [Plasmodiophora brassicae]
MAVDTSSPPQGPAGQDLSTVSLDPQRPGPSQDAPTRTAYTAEQYHHFCEELTRQVAARDQEIQRLKAELASRQSPVDWTAQVKTPESFEKSDRLTGTQNWYTWSRRINNALDQAGLSAFLTGEAVCPLKPPGSHSCTCVGVANPFHRVDRAVAAFVCNQIADQCTVEAKAFPSTRHLLAHLDREYGSGRPEVKRSLVLEQRTRLDRLDHPTTPEKLKTFIVQVDDIQARLTDLGEPLSPEDVALKIIAKFDDPSQRAQALMSQKLSWDDLKTKMRINGILASSSSARAQNPVKRPRDAQQGARSSCSFCGIPGHGDADCRHRKKASEHFKAQRSKKAEAKPKPTSNGQTVKAINITDVFGDIPNTADMIEAYPYDSTTTSNSPPEPRCDIPVASGYAQ